MLSDERSKFKKLEGGIRSASSDDTPPRIRPLKYIIVPNRMPRRLIQIEREKENIKTCIKSYPLTREREAVDISEDVQREDEAASHTRRLLTNCSELSPMIRRDRREPKGDDLVSKMRGSKFLIDMQEIMVQYPFVFPCIYFSLDPYPVEQINV